MNKQVLHAHSYWRACSINLRRLFYYARAECKFTPFLCKRGTRRSCKQHSKIHNWQTANPVQFWSIKCSCEGTFSLSGQRAARQMGLTAETDTPFFARLSARYAVFWVIHHIPASSCIPYVRCFWSVDARQIMTSLTSNHVVKRPQRYSPILGTSRLKPEGEFFLLDDNL